MKLARYMGDGRVAIVEESAPSCPAGGLLVRTEASGLCSGELMSWYMDKKIPHVLGHEVAGIVIESQDPRFPVGSRVAPHHHAPCGKCKFCQTNRPVHCETWRRTRLLPGGMAEVFAVSAENLSDTHRVDSIDPKDAALMEPLACVMKAIWLAQIDQSYDGATFSVIGLGVMGLLHMLSLEGFDRTGYDLIESRREWATGLGLTALSPEQATQDSHSIVFVCPGSQRAFDLAVSLCEPEGTIVMFAPLGPGETLSVPQSAYFKDLKIVNSYSCGPEDTRAAISLLEKGVVKAAQVVSDFISLEDLPAKYLQMKAGEILKPMVIFDR